MPNRTLEGLDEEEKEEKEVAVVVVRKEDSYGPCPHLRDSKHSLNLAPNQENVSQCLILASFGYSSVQSAVVDNRQVNGCTFSRCDGSKSLTDDAGVREICLCVPALARQATLTSFQRILILDTAVEMGRYDVGPNFSLLFMTQWKENRAHPPKDRTSGNLTTLYGSLPPADWEY
jgi:hypothetical protein